MLGTLNGTSLHPLNPLRDKHILLTVEMLGGFPEVSRLVSGRAAPNSAPKRGSVASRDREGTGVLEAACPHPCHSLRQASGSQCAVLGVLLSDGRPDRGPWSVLAASPICCGHPPSPAILYC